MSQETNVLPDKPTKRMQIVEDALKLFTENGFYATGVDLIMRQSNISKRTMYVYFPTKNDLIVAVLALYRENAERNLSGFLARIDLSSRGKILAIFDDAEKWFGDARFHGCLAVNAMGEFAGKDPNIEAACRLFKTWELGVFYGLTKDLPVTDPDGLAFKLLVLLEGLGAIAQVFRQTCPVDVHQIVNALIDQHCSAAARE